MPPKINIHLPDIALPIPVKLARVAATGSNVAIGNTFPSSPNQGDFFIRSDFQPNRLFQYNESRWIRLYDEFEQGTWSDRTFNGSTFINERGTDVDSTGEYGSRQSITDAILPRPDYDGDTGTPGNDLDLGDFTDEFGPNFEGGDDS